MGWTNAYMLHTSTTICIKQYTRYKILSSEYIKILGITMDRVLSMEKDISNTCRAANMRLLQ